MHIGNCDIFSEGHFKLLIHPVAQYMTGKYEGQEVWLVEGKFRESCHHWWGSKGSFAWNHRYRCSF